MIQSESLGIIEDLKNMFVITIKTHDLTLKTIKSDSLKKKPWYKGECVNAWEDEISVVACNPQIKRYNSIKALTPSKDAPLDNSKSFLFIYLFIFFYHGQNA